VTPAALDVVVPGALATLTGGYGYDRAVIDALRSRGHAVTVHELDGDWPHPDGDARAAAATTLAALPAARRVLIDGLAFGVLPELARAERDRLALIALVHHPLALESGVSDRDARAFERSERRALAAAMQVVTTSPATTRALVADYGVPVPCVATIPPGTDPAPLSLGSFGGATNLLSVATLSRRKGHDVLLNALATLVDRDWRLHCVGSATRDPATAAALHDQTVRLGLEGRVSFDGELDNTALAARWAEADLFVLASRHEGYGMVFDEAIARGLPIVASGAGAVADTVPVAAGRVVPPDDVDALAAALAIWFDDSTARDEWRAGARDARASVRSWRTVGEEFGHLLNTMARPGDARSTEVSA